MHALTKEGCVNSGNSDEPGEVGKLKCLGSSVEMPSHSISQGPRFYQALYVSKTYQFWLSLCPWSTPRWLSNPLFSSLLCLFFHWEDKDFYLNCKETLCFSCLSFNCLLIVFNSFNRSFLWTKCSCLFKILIPNIVVFGGGVFGR